MLISFSSASASTKRSRIKAFRDDKPNGKLKIKKCQLKAKMIENKN